MLNLLKRLFKKTSYRIIVYCWLNGQYINIDNIADNKFHDTIRYMFNNGESTRKYFDGDTLYNLYVEFVIVEI